MAFGARKTICAVDVRVDARIDRVDVRVDARIDRVDVRSYNWSMNIQEKIFAFAAKNKRFSPSQVRKGLGDGFSRQYISNQLNILFQKSKLLREGAGKYVFYALPENKQALSNNIVKRYKRAGLKEHEVLFQIKKEEFVFAGLRDNVSSIFDYAFSEMLNNAIEHSRSENIEIRVEKTGQHLMFQVRDFGIGVFRNVMEKRHLKSELEAIQDLLKGKTTTAPKAHSGEGIFFTSKAADIFMLESFGLRLRIDNLIHDVFVEEIPSKIGTLVMFSINVRSHRHLNDIFKKFQADPAEFGFTKTEITIRLYTMGTIYVSRSQARRLLSGLEKFQTVVLDFDRVPTVGQAFADEIFRVFQTKYPHIKILTENANEAVQFMIQRVEKPF